MRLLLVEDNPQLGPMVAEGLRCEGNVVDLAVDGEEAINRSYDGPYDAVVLDLMLPKIDGLTVLDLMRKRGDRTPVLILTAMDEVRHRVEGLNRGADDYLVKPFEFDELLARIHAIVRRASGSSATNAVVIADLEIDIDNKLCRRGGKSVRLSVKEFAVLECLVLRKGRSVPRETLLDVIYDGDEQPASNVVEVYIGALRRKIDKGQPSKLIHTRRGIGYMLTEEP